MGELRIPVPAVDFQPPVYYCRRAKGPLAVDGNLDKEFWRDAPFTELFADITGDASKTPRFATRVKMLWDDEYFYFGALLKGDEIWASLTERDCVIFQDNDFEIFIDPDSDTHRYFEFEMNALNTVWDLFLPKPYRDYGGKPLNGWDIKGLQTAVSIDGVLNDPGAKNRRWTAEIAIPFATLFEMAEEARPPKKGEYYRVNFSRVQWLTDTKEGRYQKRTDDAGRFLPEDNWVWAPTGLVNIHYPELWGFVFFTENGEEYEIPPEERTKWELRRYYYAQHSHFDRFGCFTADISKLLPQEEQKILPHIAVTEHGFEIACVCPGKASAAVIEADGCVRVFDRTERERRLRCVPEILCEQCSDDEMTYIRFLYENAPCQDLAMLEPEFFLKTARHALSVRKRAAWKDMLTEDLFLNYVLQYRINNEFPEFYQAEISEKLFDRVCNMTAYKAALEVNFWCLSQAVYRSTDDRTASALTVMKRGFGRCGEESTLAVSALRSVGLPARQCYAPRWSHCDDNHAWVEVFTGDGWHYLGACEPELTLDTGWFTNPASRAMLVHTKVFSDRTGGEEKLSTSGRVTGLNILEHYAGTVFFTVRVTDREGGPLAGVQVRFEVVNYAQLYPVAKLITGKDGKAGLRLGLGSIVVHLSDENGAYRWRAADTRTEQEITMVLDGQMEPESETCEFLFAAPAGQPCAEPGYTPEEKRLLEERISAADSVRKEKERGFYTVERAFDRYGREDFARLLALSGGNAGQLERFWNGIAPLQKDLAVKLLFSLKEKDLADIEADTLTEYLERGSRYINDYPEDIFVPYLLCPGIGTERVLPFADSLKEAFTKGQTELFEKNPELPPRWVRDNILLWEADSCANLMMPPCAVLHARGGDPASVKGLCVALLRQAGVPARLNKTDGSVAFYRHGGWHTRSGREEEENSAWINLEREPGSELRYYANITLARLERGVYQTLDLSDCAWAYDTPRFQAAPGRYRLLVTERLPDGSNMVSSRAFEAEAGKEVSLYVQRLYRDSAQEGRKMGTHRLTARDGMEFAPDRELADGGMYAVCWIGPSEEPTEHLLNELMEMKDRFAALPGRVILAVRSFALSEQHTLSNAQKMLPGLCLVTDEDWSVSEEYDRWELPSRKLPLILLLKDGLAYHAFSGYQVGIGDMIYKLINRR